MRLSRYDDPEVTIPIGERRRSRQQAETFSIRFASHNRTQVFHLTRGGGATEIETFNSRFVNRTPVVAATRSYDASEDIRTMNDTRKVNDLSGKLAVVTGGSSGIGYAIARRFASHGAHVVIVGRNQEKLDKAVERIGHGASGIKADVANDAELEAVFARFKQVDILATCAGGSTIGPVDQITPQDARDLFAVRVFGQFAAAHYAVPRMIEGGVVLFCSGNADVAGLVPYSVGSGVDGALNAMARSLAVELGPRGIRVNAVSPGFIGDTEIKPTKGVDLMKPFLEGMLKVVPLGRAGESEDVADAAMFLVTCPYVTGQIVEVDGGRSAF